MKKDQIKLPLLLILCLLAGCLNVSCGGGGGGGGETTGGCININPGGWCDDDSDDVGDEGDDTINTAKLIGTPFDGLTTGDVFDLDFILCGQYRTDLITEFPLLIFTAFFTAHEEELIQEGIDVANEAIGFTAYAVTETWSDDVRVIYKVETLNDAVGHTYTIDQYFNDLNYAELQSTDWIIELTESGIFKNAVAHELGHATGIKSHDLIDYENNALIDLENNSLMGTQGPYTSNPAMDDYNFMMSMQGQIMMEHLGEEGASTSVTCD